MGWISSSIKAQGLSDRWVDIEVQEILKSSAQARIWDGDAIERQSSVVGDWDKATTFSSDFVLPSDLVLQDNFRVSQPSLWLSTRMQSTLTTPLTSTPGLSEFQEPTAIESYSASMTFAVWYEGPNTFPNSPPENAIRTSSADDESPPEQDDFTITMFLIHDVQFVSAHPCIPPNNNALLPTSYASPSPTPRYSENLGTSSPVLEMHDEESADDSQIIIPSTKATLTPKSRCLRLSKASYRVR